MDTSYKKNLKMQVLIWLFLFIFIFSIARLIKTFVYNSDTDSNMVISVGDNYFIISGEQIHSTEEWERAIRAHNKSNIDEIESSKTNDEEYVKNESSD